MKNQHTSRIGHPPVFLVPFLVVFALLLGIAVVYAMANTSYSELRTQKGTSFTVSDIDLIESRPPILTKVDSLSQVALPSSLSKALASDFDVRPCASFTQGGFSVKILALSPDTTQALVGLSCGGSGMENAIFISSNAGWTKLGGSSFVYRHQTGSQFSVSLDLPSCEDTNEFLLDKTIAPICYEGNPDNPTNYIVRPADH